MPNVELAARILEQIEAHPEQHDQGFWRVENACGTTMCIAGWACHLSGDEFADGFGRVGEWANEKDDAVWRYTDVRTSDGNQMRVEQRAADLLDIGYGGNHLFYLDNDYALEALRALAAGDPDWMNEEDEDY